MSRVSKFLDKLSLVKLELRAVSSSLRCAADRGRGGDFRAMRFSRLITHLLETGDVPVGPSCSVLSLKVWKRNFGAAAAHDAGSTGRSWEAAIGLDWSNGRAKGCRNRTGL